MSAGRWLRLLGGVLAGVLFALPFDAPALGLLTLVAFALLWRLVSTADLRAVVITGAVVGMVFLGSHLSWLDASIGRGAWLLLSAAQMPYVVLAVVGIRLVAPLPAAPLWGAAVWVSVEMLRTSWPLGGLPWGRVGITVVDTPMSGLLPALGVDGAGLVLAASGFLAGSLLQRPRPAQRTRYRVRAVTLVAGIAATATLPIHDHGESGSLTIALVQGGVPGDGTEVLRNQREVTRAHARATSELLSGPAGEDVDVVLWPESSTSVDPTRDPRAREQLRRSTDGSGVPLVFGGVQDGPMPATALNRSFLWEDDDQRPRALYTKQHLVPFGEYLPWRSIIEDWSPRFDEIGRDMVPGRPGQRVVVAGIPAALAICFDIAYDDVVADQVRRGAEMVLVQTSNAMFLGTRQLDQQLLITRARALESARSVAVASINGATAVIGPDGRVQARVPRGRTEVLTASISLSRSVTPAVRWQSQRRTVIWMLAGTAVLLGAGQTLRRTPRSREQAQVKRPVAR